MRVVVLVVLALLALIAAFAGSLSLALGIAACKSALVAFEYMELRHANRAHLVGFVVAIALLASTLALVT